ncbi:MAG: type I-E CRISPR-associated protein Cas7/Cse4/CasC [Candidatus Omnitrophota bacterium]|nr:type I-E CRISPR-associated protein Cas7/Cse4/CasC [Candidatus Omnitrophota bacterium]
MSKFVQLHLLTNYGPANLNRDDLNRPKTAIVGGVQRLRVSSQSLKRAWRTSEVFEVATGIRTKEMGSKIFSALVTDMKLEDVLSGKDVATARKSKVVEEDAKEWAWKIASVFVDKRIKDSKSEDGDKGEENEDKVKSKKDKKSNIDKKTLKAEQIVFYYPEEISNISQLIEKLKSEKKAPLDKDVNVLLVNKGKGVDVGMFGRMMACSPIYNVEAAVQVAHAFTVHKAAVEDDYFSAVDDLNKKEEHSGSGHIGEAEFGAGLFYLYVCIDRDLLKENLGRNDELVKNAIKALIESAATVSPTGKQNSFASRAYASYILAEKGDKQPRSLAGAFLKPVSGDEVLDNAIKQAKNTREAFNKVYGDTAQAYELNAAKGEGTLDGLKNYCVSE